MKHFPIVSALGTAVLAAALAGCGGGAPPASGSLAPAGSEAILHPAITPQRVLARISGRAPQRRAGHTWMSPDAKGAALLYAADSGADEVNVYSSSTFAPLGILLGFADPGSMCVDKAQDVYVPDLVGARLTEYAHGAIAPTRTIADNEGTPLSCAIDSGSGDLAVANFAGPSGAGLGNVIVYRAAKGRPAKYTVPGFFECYFVAYDDNGDLFVDGFNSSLSAFLLAELPKGKHAFKSITTNQPIGFPGDVAWDGEFLAVGDQLTNTIYQFRVSRSKARVHGSTPLSGASDVFQFFLTGGNSKHPQATAVLGADLGNGDVAKWQYPAGGTPLKTISGLRGPEGVVISN